jgi:hypothetical protein
MDKFLACGMCGSHPVRPNFSSAEDCCETSHASASFANAKGTRHAKTVLGHHLKHPHHANNCVSIGKNGACTKTDLTSDPFHLANNGRKLYGLGQGIQFGQIQKDIEAVWAVAILLQSPEVIDHLMQCHLPNALGSHGSLIGIDFVSYSHGSILPARGMSLFRLCSFRNSVPDIVLVLIKQAQLIVAFGPRRL